ncbi:MAG TPA: hypothetical protein PLO47_00115 [Bacillota bacterium]|nr:hypothetical protein [Bacillota bacterium]
MHENANAGFGRHILRGYIRPFTSGGFLPFIVSFVLSAIPIVQFFVPAIAFKDTRDLRGGDFRKTAMLSLKMFAATLLLFAPPLALYLLIHLLGITLKAGPVWLLYVLLGLMLLFAVSALIRLPMALLVLSRGGCVREALDGRFVKILISACFGRYLASLLSLIPLAFLALFIDLMPLWLAYIYCAFLSAWIFMYIGYVMNRCYDQTAPAEYPSAGAPPEPFDGRRYARTALSLLLVVAMLNGSVSVFAFNEDEQMASGNYPKHRYTAKEYDAAVEKFARNGQLNQYTQLYYDSDTGRFYCATKPGTGEKADAMFIAVLGFTADCLPVIGTAKNVIEAAYYKSIASDPNRSREERAAAQRMQYLKTMMAALSLAGPIGKAASGVTGKGVVPFLIVRAGTTLTDPTMRKIISAADDALWGWDMVGNIHNIVDVVDRDVGDMFAPFTPQGSIGAYSSPPASGGTDQPAEPGQPQDGYASPDGDYSPFWGTYKGTLQCSQNSAEAYGVVGYFENPEITITLNENGSMTLSYTFESSYAYETYGVSMSGTTTIPVSFGPSVALLRTLGGYMMQEERSGAFTATSVTRYGGEAYGGEGGELTSTADYQVRFFGGFELQRVNGQIVAIADGYVIQKPLDSDESLYMSFRITKVD